MPLVLQNSPMNRVIAHLRLMRPANIITAVADILAGFAAAGAMAGAYGFSNIIFEGEGVIALIWLCLATIGLYGGGVVFNDVFDAELDKVERPERAIPSGQASTMSASLLGASLLLLGILAAWQVNMISGLLAITVALLALLYDSWGKHQLYFGPLNMGLCRGGNLLLGVSVLPELVTELWFLGLIPVVYIAAITMISRGEVHGGNRKALQGGVVMYAAVILTIVVLAFFTPSAWWQVLPFVALFAYLIFPPLLNALRKQEPSLIGKAVKAGVISLIVMNAALATAFAGWMWGVGILLLLPVSRWMARSFAVT